MSAQAVFLCVFNVNISLYDWHVCFCLSAAGADAVYCCLFTAQTTRNPEQLPSLSCAGTQRRPVLCHRWDQVSQKMRTLTLLDREIKKKGRARSRAHEDTLYQLTLKENHQNRTEEQLQVRRLRSLLYFTTITCWIQTACVGPFPLQNKKVPDEEKENEKKRED